MSILPKVGVPPVVFADVIDTAIPKLEVPDRCFVIVLVILKKSDAMSAF